MKMVELAFGVTILPKGSVHTRVARGSLRVAPISDFNLTWDFGIAYLKSEYLTPALESFIKLCRAYIGHDQ